MSGSARARILWELIDTTVILSRCGEVGFQVALGGYVGYHSETFKKVISVGVYLKGGHDSIHVAVRYFLGADVCVCLANLGPIRALVGKVAKLLAPKALELVELLRLPLAIIGVHFAIG